jgi:hypothetical protein
MRRCDCFREKLSLPPPYVKWTGIESMRKLFACTACLAVLVLAMFACVYTYPESFQESTTIESLRMFGETMAFLYEEDKEPVPSCDSLADVLNLALKHGYIRQDEIDKQRYLTDGWGNKLHWKKDQGRDATVIVIISSGRNQVYEEGQGDDYSVEVRFLADGTIQKKYKNPTDR